MTASPLPTPSPVADCCPPLSVRALAPETAGELAPMFKALGDPIRLRLLSLIASTDEVCVCDLTDAFEVTPATISHHLRVLRESGLVDAERRGTWMYYSVRRPALALLGRLLSTEGPGSPQVTTRTAPGIGTPGLAVPPMSPEAATPHQNGMISANSDVVKLLADPLRARIVEILAAGPATTSHLVTGTGAKQPNVSGHLRLLREAGVVEAEPRGRHTLYRLVPRSLQGAALHLAALAAQAQTHSDNVRTC